MAFSFSISFNLLLDAPLPLSSLAGRLARDTAVIVFLMALDVPELKVTAEFFPHEWIWEILAVSAACVKCSTGHIMVIKGVGVRSTDVIFVHRGRLWPNRMESTHTESSPGLKQSSTHRRVKYMLINF